MNHKKSKTFAVILAVIAVVAVVAVSVLVAKSHKEKDSVGADGNGTVSDVLNTASGEEITLGENTLTRNMYEMLLAEGVSGDIDDGSTMPDTKGMTIGGESDAGENVESGLPDGMDSHAGNMDAGEDGTIHLLQSNEEGDGNGDADGQENEDGNGSDVQNGNEDADGQENEDGNGSDGQNGNGDADGQGTSGDDSEDNQQVSLAGAVVGRRTDRHD